MYSRTIKDKWHQLLKNKTPRSPNPMQTRPVFSFMPNTGMGFKKKNNCSVSNRTGEGWHPAQREAQGRQTPPARATCGTSSAHISSHGPTHMVSSSHVGIIPGRGLRCLLSFHSACWDSSPPRGCFCR